MQLFVGQATYVKKYIFVTISESFKE